jgi:endonuclease III related protein
MEPTPGRLRPQNVPAKLKQYYVALFDRLGPQGWWPGRTRLEVILGAILTQNTSWRNAARAIGEFRKVGLLKLSRLERVTQVELEPVVRPAGFYRQKAATIRGFLDWLTASCGGSLPRMFARPTEELREELLKLRGFGPETVDAILVYAGQRPSFVADAYTRRILARHGLVEETAGYEAVRDFLHEHLPADAALFNEYHALLVEVGKRYCRKERPKCEGCPLESFLVVDVKWHERSRSESTFRNRFLESERTLQTNPECC